jgi:hypothetical protein
MSAAGTAEAGVATQVSYPGGQVAASGGGSAAPGAQGLGSSMTPAQAALWLILGAGVSLVAIGIVFRRPIGSAD